MQTRPWSEFAARRGWPLLRRSARPTSLCRTCLVLCGWWWSGERDSRSREKLCEEEGGRKEGRQRPEAKGEHEDIDGVGERVERGGGMSERGKGGRTYAFGGMARGEGWSTWER